MRKPQGLIASSTLSEAELRQIRTLRDVCNAREGLRLKLNLLPGDASQPPSRFLYFDRGTLVGYAALDGGGFEAELCGMVHPMHRRHGIGRELLEAARAACRRDGVERLLLICEEASRSGQAFVATLAATREFAELHQEMATQPGLAPQTPRLIVRQAGDDDADAIAHVVAAAFGGDEQRVRARLTAEMAEPTSRFYVGELGGQVIGSLKVYLDGNDGKSAGIYAFGILPAHRQHGYGRELLTATVDQLRREGFGHVYLEVDADNEPAQRLYRSVGFSLTTIYVYYAVPL
jgi:mycothiol synthase